MTMNGTFADEYWKAAIKKIVTLEGMGAWKIIDQTDDLNVIDH